MTRETETGSGATEIPVRRRLAIYLGGCLLFAAGAAMFVYAAVIASDAVVGILGICSATLAVLSGLNLRRPQPWRISEEGITLSTAIASEHYAWRDVTSFRVGPAIAGTWVSMSFDFVPGHQPHGIPAVVTAVTRFLMGADRNWPNLTMMDTPQLVRLINQRHRDRGDAHSRLSP